jgi:uncharacterized protein (TIGR03435 family)
MRTVCCLLFIVAVAAAQPIAFDVASVKPSDPRAQHTNVLLGAGESLTVENVPLRKIITYAYDIRDFQLAGGPGWISDERYDIMAKSALATGATADPTAETDAQRRDRVARVRERLRSLLADRFGLRVHIEQRERTVLALRVAKGGPKLKDAAEPRGTVSTNDGRIQGFGAPVSMLVTQLANVTGLMVQDETSLNGKYDFLLEFSPDNKNPDDPRPSIQTAVEQLGLRLEQTKAPVKTVVIDSVERPSAN